MYRPGWMRPVARTLVVTILAGLVPVLPSSSVFASGTASASAFEQPQQSSRIGDPHPGTILPAANANGSIFILEAGTSFEAYWKGQVHLYARGPEGDSKDSPILLVDGQPLGRVPEGGVGLDTPTLQDGPHGLSLVVAGEQVQSHRIIVDNTPPILDWVELEGGRLPGTPFRITAKVHDALAEVASVAVSLSDGTYLSLSRTSDGSWGGTIPGAVQARTFELVATDTTGNQGRLRPNNDLLDVASLPAPERLMVEPVQGGIALQWEAAPLPGGTRYTVFRKEGRSQSVAIATTELTSYVDIQVTPSEVYTYSVAVSTSDGVTGPSGPLVEATVTEESMSTMDTPEMTMTSGQSAVTTEAVSTKVGGTITGNVTWTRAASPYVLTSSVTVPAGSTLTIEPGVVVKLGNLMRLLVKGQLQAIGQADSPIIFTSVKDDGNGGDTNGDGSATAPAAGNWLYVQTDVGAVATLQHVTALYGTIPIYANGGTVHLDDANIQFASSRGVQLSGTSWVRNSTFSAVPNFGVYVTGGTPEVSGVTISAGSYGILVDSGNPIVTGNTIQGGPNTVGIGYAPTAVAGGTLTNNIVTGTKYAADLAPSQGRIEGLSVSGNTFTGNTYNGFGLGGSFGGTSTLPLVDHPYVLRGMSVSSGASLTVPSGTIVKVLPNVALTNNGTLALNGLELAPVTFTSIKDDSIGGDTNGDGTATAPAAGDWQQVKVNNGRASHTAFRYAGQLAVPSVSVTSGTALLDHIQVSDVLGSGVSFTGGTADLSDSVISASDNAVSMTGGIVTVDRNVLRGSKGVFLNGGTPTVRGNSITLSPTGIYVDTGTQSAVIEDNTISEATNSGILLYAYQKLLTGITLTGNTVTASRYAAQVSLDRAGLGSLEWRNSGFGSGNTYNGYGLSGQVGVHTVLSPVDLPWVVPDLVVGAGANLAVAPGTILKLTSSSAGLLSSGSLSLRGLAERPVVITSVTDDLVDGNDTNGDGPSTPTGGAWDAVSPTNGGSVDLDWVRVLYGGYGGGAVYSGCSTCAITISNTEFAYSSGSGIRLLGTAGAAISLSQSRFHHNSYAGVHLTNGNSARITGSEFSDQPYGIRFLGPDQSHIMSNKIERNRVGILYWGYDSAQAPTIANNSLSGNTEAGVDNAFSITPMKVTYNWWGSDRGPGPYGPGDVVKGPAWFEPYTGQQYYQSRQYAGAWWTAKAQNVDLPTGDYTTSVVDTGTTGGLGLPVQIGRTYHSSNRTKGLLGIGWVLSYELALEEDATTGEVNVTYGSGQQSRFTWAADGTYTPPPGEHNRLTRGTDGSWELLTKARTAYRFRSDGKLEKIIDRNLNEITLTYAGTQLDEITDAAGRGFELYYDEQGRLKEVIDPDGQHVVYSYDPVGRLEQVKDVRLGLTTYTYDAEDRLVQIQDQTQRTLVKLSYDGNGRIATRENAIGDQVVYTYDLLQRRSTVTDALGQTVTDYDEFLRVSSIKDANQNTSIRVYDDLNNIKAIQDAGSGVTTFDYDQRHNLRKVADPLGNLTEYLYDENDQVVEVIDPLLNRTQLEYDVRGNLLKITDPKQKATVNTYYPGGLLHTTTDPLNHTSTFTYDAHGNVQTSQNAALKTWTYSSDALGRRTQVTDPYLHSTYWLYDGFGNVVEVQDTDGVWVEKRTYDAAGRLLTTTDGANGVTAYEYDQAGRMWIVTDPRNSKTTYSYDGNGNLKSQTNQLGQTTQYQHDAMNRLSSVMLPDGLTKYQYQYDAMGRLKQVLDGLSHTRSYAYDLAGRLKTETDHLQRTWLYEYDKNGNRLSTVDPNLGMTTFAYDELNRLSTVAAPGNLTVSYQYDDIGNVVQMVDSTGTTLYQYNALNLLERKTAPDGKWIGYEYDDAGRLWKTTDFGGSVSERLYDSRSRLNTVVLPGNEEVAYTYDGANRWKTRSYPNGYYTHVGRDAAGLITLVENVRPDQTVHSSFSYVPDELGRYKQVTDASGVTAYAYEVNGRLETESLPDGRIVTYAYDQAGNRTSRTATGGAVSGTETTAYTYDATDRLQTVTEPSGSTVTYSYDANGNMTGDGTRVYRYDGLNRLAEVQQGGTTLATYDYDGNGLRWSKSTAGGTVRYYYDGALIANEGDGTTITASNHWGLDLLRRDAGTQTGYYLYNGHGDVASVLDPNGTEVGAYRYDAFGEPLAISETIPNPFRYAGEPYDEETGLIYLRARYYSPSLGRFITQDTYKGSPWQPWTQNLYVYVGNNPVRYTDPTGHCAEGVCDDANLGTTYDGTENLAAYDAMVLSTLSMMEASQYGDCLEREKAVGRENLPVGCYAKYPMRFWTDGSGQQQMAGDSMLEQADASLGIFGAGFIIRAGAKTPRGRVFSPHAAERSQERGFGMLTIDAIVDNNYKSRTKQIDVDNGVSKVKYRYQDKRGNYVVVDENGVIVTMSGPGEGGMYQP